LLRPQRSPEAAESGQRFVQSGPRRRSPPSSALSAAEREKRTRTMERIRATVVFRQRALELLERGIELTAGREQLRPAAVQDCQCPCPVDGASPGLPHVDDATGLVQRADGDQRLHQIAELEPLRWFEHEVVPDLIASAQMDQGLLGPAEGEFQE